MAEASAKTRFPIARRLLRLATAWRLRHQNRFNFWIHLIGIPIAMSSLVLWQFVAWEWSIAAFLFGYLLQYVGHRIEGNDVGELIPIKRWLGWPVVAIAPQNSLPQPPELR